MPAPSVENSPTRRARERRRSPNVRMAYPCPASARRQSPSAPTARRRSRGRAPAGRSRPTRRDRGRDGRGWEGGAAPAASPHGRRDPPSRPRRCGRPCLRRHRRTLPRPRPRRYPRNQARSARRASFKRAPGKADRFSAVGNGQWAVGKGRLPGDCRLPAADSPLSAGLRTALGKNPHGQVGLESPEGLKLGRPSPKKQGSRSWSL